MKDIRHSKHPCVVSTDALWILTAAGQAMLLLPLEPHERVAVEDAAAQAHKAMVVAAGIPGYALRADWVEERMEVA